MASLGFTFRAEDGEYVYGGMITRPPQVDEIPFADFSDFDFERYLEPNLLNLVLSRGCVFRCTFCSEAPAFLKYRSYLADRILGEVDHVLATSNARRPLRVEFNDSLLNGDLKALEGLADGLIARGEQTFGWGGMMALRKQMSNELVDKLARAGCASIFVGMESGSPKVIRAMKKGHDLPTAKRLTKAMHEAGIAVTASIVAGYPGEGEAEFYETLDALREIAPNIDTVMLHTLALSTGSILTANPERFGIDPTTITGHDSWDWVSEDGTNTPEIRLHRLFTLQHMLHGKVVDYGGTMDRQAGLYDPFEELQRKELERQRLIGGLLEHIAFEPESAPAGESYGVVDQLIPLQEGRIGLRGWARALDAAGPAVCVLALDEDGRVLGHGFCEARREDVARELGCLADKRFGFEFTARAPRGELSVCVYHTEDHRALRLESAGQLAETVDER